MRMQWHHLKALLAADMAFCHVPFWHVAKPVLSEHQFSVLEDVRKRVSALARAMEVPWPPHTDHWLEHRRAQEADIALSAFELEVLDKIACAAVNEFKDDGDVSTLVGPGVGLGALYEAYAMLKKEGNAS